MVSSTLGNYFVYTVRFAEESHEDLDVKGKDLVTMVWGFTPGTWSVVVVVTLEQSLLFGLFGRWYLVD